MVSQYLITVTRTDDRAHTLATSETDWRAVLLERVAAKGVSSTHTPTQLVAVVNEALDELISELHAEIPL